MLLNASCALSYVSSAYSPTSTKKILIQPNKLGIGMESIRNSQNHANPLVIRGGSLGSLNPLTIRYIAINPAAASLIAGSIAGACGVGIAFPLDTLKTKSQVLGSAQAGLELDVSTAADGSSSAALVGDDVSKMNMFQLIGLIYRLEGISGFYGGVKGMMVGQGASLHAFLVHRAFIPNLHSFLMQF